MRSMRVAHSLVKHVIALHVAALVEGLHLR